VRSAHHAGCTAEEARATVNGRLDRAFPAGGIARPPKHLAPCQSTRLSIWGVGGVDPVARSLTSQRGFRSGVLAASTPWLVRSDRPSSIVAPNRHITDKKQKGGYAARGVIWTA
jgi:hypothetical protein